MAPPSGENIYPKYLFKMKMSFYFMHGNETTNKKFVDESMSVNKPLYFQRLNCCSLHGGNFKHIVLSMPSIKTYRTILISINTKLTFRFKPSPCVFSQQPFIIQCQFMTPSPMNDQYIYIFYINDILVGSSLHQHGEILTCVYHLGGEYP